MSRRFLLSQAVGLAAVVVVQLAEEEPVHVRVVIPAQDVVPVVCALEEPPEVYSYYLDNRWYNMDGMNEQFNQIPASEIKSPSRWEQAFGKLPPNLRNVIYAGALSALLVACGSDVKAPAEKPHLPEIHRALNIQAERIQARDINKVLVTCVDRETINVNGKDFDVTQWQRKPKTAQLYPLDQDVDDPNATFIEVSPVGVDTKVSDIIISLDGKTVASLSKEQIFQPKPPFDHKSTAMIDGKNVFEGSTIGCEMLLTNPTGQEIVSDSIVFSERKASAQSQK